MFAANALLASHRTRAAVVHLMMAGRLARASQQSVGQTSLGCSVLATSRDPHPAEVRHRARAPAVRTS